MNPPIPNRRFKTLDGKENIESFKKEQEEAKLSLRKKHIFNALLTKRQSMLIDSPILESKYRINIKDISTNQEIMNDPELYVKNKFNIENWFKYLFSQTLNQIKEALFIIELFIRLQLKELPPEKRFLSMNDTELINGLSDYLNHQDKQIVFYACSCLSNLTFFPNNIGSIVTTERNLKKILEFFNTNDFNFGHQILILLINCNTGYNQRKFFIENGIIERLAFIMEKTLDKLESRYYIYIIRLLNNIRKIFDECDDYNKQQKLKWFLQFLPFIKKTITNSYVKNPWAKTEDCRFYLELLKFYVSIDIKNKDYLFKIINEEFSQILIEYYYKINDIQCKNILMKIFADLLSIDDGINEQFIDDGILGLLLNEINSIEYTNLELLNNILLACSNIACGTIGQIEQLYMQGLVWKCFDIIKYFSNKNLNAYIKKIIFNCIYIITEVITGTKENIKIDLIMYQDYEIIKIFVFIFKNILEIKDEHSLLLNMGSSIVQLILCGESNMDEGSFINFKNELLKNGIEEIIEDIITNYKIDENIINTYCYIQSLLEE